VLKYNKIVFFLWSTLVKQYVGIVKLVTKLQGLKVVEPSRK
jgi:hypothetical protein